MTDTYTVTTGRDKLGEILDKCRAWSENTFENAVVMPSELYTSTAVGVVVIQRSPPDVDGGEISEEFREKTREFVFSFLSEDKEIIESVQKNLPVFEPTQPYCDMERTNWEFGQYLVRRLLAEAAR